MNRFGMLASLVVAMAWSWAGCSSGGPGGTGTGAAGTGSKTGAAGTGVSGVAGTSGAAGPGAAGTSGAAGVGAAGTGAAAGTSGAAGTNAAAGTSGGAGLGAAGNGSTSGGAGTGVAGGSPDGGSPTDAGPVTTDAGSHGNKVLLYTKSTGFVHDSTVTAAAAIAKAAAAAGLVTETSADPTKFTTAGLAGYAGVVLIATAGEPMGSPGTTQVQALIDWVRAGGGLVGIENANHAYDNNKDYIGLLGGHFNGHSGLGPDFCYKEGDNPSVAKLPATYMVTDEIYYTDQFRMDNQVVLRCASDRRAIAWVRQEGAGRVFYTTLGHMKEMWSNPPLVDSHVLPGLLWAMGRPVP
jgi:type 1 glutamine amidotransferase